MARYPTRGPDSKPQAVPIGGREWIDKALEAAADPTVSAEDRVALYAVLYRIQQTIRRGLGIGVRSAATPQAELVAHLEANGLRELGPVQVKATAFDVTWPINAPDNWEDDGLQNELAVMRQIAPDYIRLVPEHYELDTAAMAHGISSGDPVAVKLQRHAADSGWRREGGRRLSLTVRP
jgi:hypothetical protein